MQVRKELQVSLFQTLCLLLFNDINEYTYQDMKTATRIGLSFGSSSSAKYSKCLVMLEIWIPDPLMKLTVTSMFYLTHQRFSSQNTLNMIKDYKAVVGGGGGVGGLLTI